MPRQLLKANADDVRKNALFLGPLIPNMAMARGSAYYFGDILAESDKQLDNKLLQGEGKRHLVEGDKVRRCISAIKELYWGRGDLKILTVVAEQYYTTLYLYYTTYCGRAILYYTIPILPIL